MEELMRCPECAAEAADTARSCVRCGAPIGTPAGQATAAVDANPAHFRPTGPAAPFLRRVGTALPGRHFAARSPHLRIPFGGRREAREALLERLAAIRPGASG